MQEVLNRVGTFILAGKDWRFVRSHGESLLVCDFLARAVEAVHGAAISGAIYPGITGTKTTCTQFGLPGNGINGFHEHAGVNTVDSPALFRLRGLLGVLHGISPVWN